MSVLVTGKFPGDVAILRQALVDRSDELVAMSQKARAAGGIHHRFGVGDGFVIVVDEWESPQAFEQFFAQPELQEFIGSLGVAGPPEITISEAITTPDEY